MLTPSTHNCAIPAGIFGDVEGAMVRMIAYGPELNLAHPPRPANPNTPWNPEWAVRVRIKSTGMTILGMEEQARGLSPGKTTQEQPATLELPSIGGVLKGIFGR